MNNRIKIAVDFDGTIVIHDYPRIGKPNPGAIVWMRRWVKAGADLILWTMRSDTHGEAGNGEPMGKTLTEAVEYCRGKGVEFYGVNENPDQHTWTSSRKAYAQIYVDDAAWGCPLVHAADARPRVDWAKVGPAVLAEIKAYAGAW